MHARKPEFNHLVERALLRELIARRSLRPHAQLAVAANASRATIDEAYARLRRRYEPSAFAEYGPRAVAAAEQITELLRAAYATMTAPAGGAHDEPGKNKPSGRFAWSRVLGRMFRRRDDEDDNANAAVEG